MKKIVFFIILIIILFAVPISVYLVGQQQELRSRASPATTLAFNPGSVSKNVGDTFSLDIQIDTGGNNVAMAELHLVYDATKLEALSITNGPAAPLIAASGVVGSGTASISVRAESSIKPITGIGTIAVVRFRALGPTTTPVKISFDPATTFVSGLEESQPNVLVNTTPATITIQGATPSPTPTLAMTPATTASNAASPTVTIIPTPTSTSSAEATSSAFTLVIPKDDNGLTSNTPIIQGTAEPGSTITIVIYSDPITAIVTVDANGNWQYTPDTPLTEGTHTLTATIQSPSGTTTTRSEEFTVASGGIGGAGDDMPVSGSVLQTILLVGIGLFFVGISVAMRMKTVPV